MSTFTDTNKAPDKDKLTSRDQICIEHTKGIWVRVNLEEDTIELWHDGFFQASWTNTARDEMINAYTAVAIAEFAVTIGERKRAKAIADLLK